MSGKPAHATIRRPVEVLANTTVATMFNHIERPLMVRGSARSPEGYRT